MAQKTAAVKRLDMAYTSPSTAENQKLSENVKAKPPTTPDPITAIMVPVSIGSRGLILSNFIAKWVMVQKRNRMVNELLSADITLMDTGTSSVGTNAENKRPMSMKSGAPGGCPISSL